MIGYVSDYFGSYQDMVVREYLEFFSAAYHIDGSARSQGIDNVLELTDLVYKSEVEVNSLSRGMQQRLSVARVLLHDPEVLLLDEPASGLDPRARIEMRELLKERDRMGKTVLISSHILLELAGLCRKIGIIERGELRFVGSMKEILERAKVGTVLNVAVATRRSDAAAHLATLPGVTGVEIQGDGLRVQLDAGQTDAAAIGHSLYKQGFRLVRLDEEKVTLETAFMRLAEGLTH